MPVEESRACLRRWVEVYNAHDVDALLALYAPGHTVNGRPVPGEAAHREYRQREFATFPDRQVTIDHALYDGDWVAAHATYRGTHAGTHTFNAHVFPPTGKPVTYRGAYLMQIVGGQIGELWQVSDNLSFLTQLGAELTSPEGGSDGG
jgi:predicted ester cyclase